MLYLIYLFTIIIFFSFPNDVLVHMYWRAYPKHCCFHSVTTATKAGVRADTLGSRRPETPGTAIAGQVAVAVAAAASWENHRPSTSPWWASRRITAGAVWPFSCLSKLRRHRLVFLDTADSHINRFLRLKRESIRFQWVFLLSSWYRRTIRLLEGS